VNIIPAIDLHDGRCVRLYQGDFARVTEYSDDPVAVARGYAELAVADLHVVDLDGARTGTQQNRDVIRELCARTRLSVQLGGGIRDATTLARWFEDGVARCVIGSLAVTNSNLVVGWLRDFGPERIVLALDVTTQDEEPILATHGWTRASGQGLWDCLARFCDAGVRHVLCTDIGRDGALTGPNLDLYGQIMARHPRLQLQASGGVRDIADIDRLRSLGVPAAITGRALLDGRITAAEVSTFLQSA